MNEWAVLWTAVLVAGNLLGVVLIVRPLLKETIDAAKSLNDMTTATLSAIRPREVLQERHGGHPILKWCAANVVVVQDHNENVKPDKAKSTERIDLVSALVNALAVALPAITGSVYDERPPLLLDL